MKRFAATIATFALLPAAAGAQGLNGSVVTGTLLYPTLNDVHAGPVVATVGSGIEFPAGSFVVGRGFSIDVAADSIAYFPGEAVGYVAAVFNGFKFDFSGAAAILSVSVGASSTIIPTAVTWDADTVFLNLSGMHVTVGDQILLAVSTVPEPATWLMLAAGAAAISFRWRHTTADRR